MCKPSKGAMYAVAIRDGNDLWLLARIRRTGINVYFLMQRDTPDWDPHASYHQSGTSQVRSYDWTYFKTQKQRPDASFRGVATVFAMGIAVGEEALHKTPCDAGKFDDVFEIPIEQFVPGEPHTLVADIVEPGMVAAPGPWQHIVTQKTFKDAVPWILVTLWSGLATSSPPQPSMSSLTRLFQFVFIVIFGMAAEVVVDFFKCLAHEFRKGTIHVDLRSIPLFVFCVSVFICILAASLVAQEKLIDFKRQRIAVVAAFIVGAIISGYFYSSPCASAP